jgi:hypothetical protein
MTATATVDRPKRKRKETPECAGGARRFLAGLAKRAAAGDLEALTFLNDMHAHIDTVMAEIAVPGLRSAEGGAYSWAEIGEALGVTRQAAQSRFPNAKGARSGGAQPAHLR